MKGASKIERVAHLVFWTLLLAVSTSLSSQVFPFETAIWLSVKSILIWAGIAYFNIYVVIPRFFRKGKFGWFIIAVLSLVLFGLFIGEIINEIFLKNIGLDIPVMRNRTPSGRGAPFRFIRFVPLFFMTIAITFFSTIYKLAKEFLEKEKQSVRLQKEKTIHELNFLRSQINPHFLFNALNNLHATVQLNPEKAGDYILKLGDMLRYVLEECKKEKVSLADEIKYLKNYIFFQKQKDEKLRNIHFEASGDDPSIFYIEPMLFIALVENAFQHSYLENTEKQWVDIFLSAKNGVVKLTVKNNLSDGGCTKKEGFGVGLKNIKRRLELLYPQKHKLISEKRDGHYFSELILNL